MKKQTALLGLMLTVGALPLTMVDAFVTDNGCTDGWGNPLPDDVHYYLSSGGFTIWEDKDDGLVILGFGWATMWDGCVPDYAGGEPGDAWDTDYETGIGGIRFQASSPAYDVDGTPCSPTVAHHTTTYFVEDFADDAHGNAGADGTSFYEDSNGDTIATPCGDGIIDGSDPSDCFVPFHGWGPHDACGVGLDGTYWVFTDTLIVDLDQGLAEASTMGCAWTSNFDASDHSCDPVRSPMRCVTGAKMIVSVKGTGAPGQVISMKVKCGGILVDTASCTIPDNDFQCSKRVEIALDDSGKKPTCARVTPAGTSNASKCVYKAA